MSEEVYKFRVWCDTEGKYETVWSETTPTSCPSDPLGHTIDQNKTSIIEQISKEHVVLDMANLEDPSLPVQRIAIQPGRTNYIMCDRDFKMSTGSINNASEDLKVNTSNNKEESWGEMSVVGIYKKDLSGDYVECQSEAEANSDAELTVFDYIARNQIDGSTISYDLKGGEITVDSDIDLLNSKWSHRFYTVLAPNVPSSLGGKNRIFDSYLAPYAGREIKAINTMSYAVDPTTSIEAGRLRIWLYYPKGTSNTHVLRLITYRPINSTEN
jgi:hypothetical protein